MKRFLIIIVTLVIVITAIGVGLHSWSHSNNRRINISRLNVSVLGNKKLDMKHVKDFNVKVRTAKVVFENAEKSSIVLKNIASKQYIINQDDDSVEIVEKNSDKHQIEIGESPIIIIKTNHDLNNIKVNQLNGTLKFKNITVDKIDINHSNGTTLSDGLALIDGGTLTKKNGKTELDGLEDIGLKVALKNGNFKLNGVKKDNHYNDHKEDQLVIKSNNGQVIVHEK